MGNIVGKQFGVVASKDYNTALTESVKEGNQGKFYLTENGGEGFDNITATTNDSRNTLIVNGNKIQGVSTSDINKIDTINSAISSAITDYGFFKYKGSVNYLSELPRNFDNASPGDVYNVNHAFVLDGVSYSAYTNVVCIGTKKESDSLKWDALGGTMEIGTSPNISVGSYDPYITKILYESIDNEPISNLEIKLDNNYLDASDKGIIYLRIGTSHSHKLYNNCVRFNSYFGLMELVDLYCKDGIEVSSIYTSEGEVAGLSLKLSTEIGHRVDLVTDISGLTINSNGLRLALATGYDKTFINGLVTVGTNHAGKGGLSIYGPSLVDYLKIDDDFKNYINLLVNNKITIQ